MNTLDLNKCKSCGNIGITSARGLCGPCGQERAEEARRQIRERSGPIYERWLAGLLKAGKPEGEKHAKE